MSLSACAIFAVGDSLPKNNNFPLHYFHRSRMFLMYFSDGEAGRNRRSEEGHQGLQPEQADPGPGQTPL